MHNRHAWTERTPKGLKREIRAIKFAGRWSFDAQLRGEEGWTPIPNPSLELLQTLRDILWRKYQRRRASFEDVQGVDLLIEAASED
jgi:hypothetical protein